MTYLNLQNQSFLVVFEYVTPVTHNRFPVSPQVSDRCTLVNSRSEFFHPSNILRAELKYIQASASNCTRTCMRPWRTASYNRSGNMHNLPLLLRRVEKLKRVSQKNRLRKCRRVVKVRAARTDAEVRVIETESASSFSRRKCRSTHRYVFCGSLRLSPLLGDQDAW